MVNAPPVMESAKPALGIRLPFLDGIRGLACLYVMLTHIWCYAYTWVLVPPHAPLYFKWLEYGHLGVTIFITLSGFCLTLPFTSRRFEPKPDWKQRFFMRRAWRILPPYYFATLASLALESLRPAVLSNHVTTLKPTTLGGIASHLLLFHDIFGVSQINYAHWSVALEWQIYFLFPLLLYFLAKLPLTTLLVSVTVACFALRLLLDQTHLVPWQFAVQFVASFTIGMVAAKLAFSGVPARSLITSGKAALAVVCVLAVSLFILPHSVNYLSEELAISVASALLMVYLAKTPASLITRCLEFQPIVFLGAMSYSLYLMHAPLLDFLGASLIRTRDIAPLPEFLLLLVVGGPAIIAASYLFYRIFEKPFVKWHHPTLASIRERTELWLFARHLDTAKEKQKVVVE